ncbi:MAG TPA: SufS family cysteine desulfurase [Solirubrobacteraceae bacterium]|jgi:cysteine desulfurase/selenocysteine lyase|nr:SufS family cysteine desulfurase [Solirubrobacteraceae bacterium]
MSTVETLAEISAEFPVLRREFDGRNVVYLDSAATSQTPQPVIDAMTRYYTDFRASVHRGVYPLAVEATDMFEGARQKIADWLGSTAEETIFTANATAAINLVAYTWGRQNIGAGDLVVLTQTEHHSNIVPWQLVCAERGAELAYVPMLDDGQLDLDALDALLARGPKLVALVHVSNVVGTINPVADIAARAHDAGAVVLVDGSQAVPQIPVDLRAIDADFYAWTGHKAYGPTGIGVLHGRRELLEAMPPFIGGGHMIRTVGDTESTWADLPWKFEAGTSQIAEAIGLGVAVDWIRAIGIDRIRAHEQALVADALARLAELPGITLHGPPDAADRGALVSFVLDGAHPHDVGEILGREGVCVRTGHHCTQPLMRRLGATATTRASYAVHNSTADTDRLIEALGTVARVLEL